MSEPQRAPRCRPLPPPTATVGGAVLLAAVSALGLGCAAPTATVVVRVEDERAARAGAGLQPPTGRPGVNVWATPANAAHPLDFAGMIRSAQDDPRAGITDAQGRASLTVPADRPFVITVWLPGYGPIGRTFDGVAEALRFGAWALVPTDPSASPPQWRAVVLSPDRSHSPSPGAEPTR